LIRDATGLGIDPSGKDVARLCFVSYDPDLYYNQHAIELEPLLETEKPQSALKQTGGVDRIDKPNKSQIRALLAVIPKRPDYPDWIKVVAAVGDALSEQDAVEVLCEWSDEEQPGEYADKLRHRLQDVHVGSLFHLAKEHGWQPKKTEQSNAPVV